VNVKFSFESEIGLSLLFFGSGELVWVLGVVKFVGFVVFGLVRFAIWLVCMGFVMCLWFVGIFGFCYYGL